MDRGHRGAQPADTGTCVVLPVQRKPGRKLVAAQKWHDATHSKICMYVENAIRRIKTFRVMGHRNGNPPKRHDLANIIVCRPASPGMPTRIAAMAWEKRQELGLGPRTVFNFGSPLRHLMTSWHFQMGFPRLKAELRGFLSGIYKPKA